MADQPPQRPPSQPPGGGPPRLERVPPPGSAPRATYGMAARQVTADAALAAGLAHDGDLGVESALRLFYLAAALQANGRLVLGAQGSQLALTFKKGVVAHVLAEAREHDLGQFLVRKGALKPEDLARAEAAKPQAGGDLVGALIGLRLVNPADVAALLTEHGGGLVTQALLIDEGRFRWDPNVTPPASAFPLGNSWAFLCGAVRTLDAAGVSRRLGPRIGQAASRVGGRIRIEDLKLTPQEARAAQLFDGARTPTELAAANPPEAVTILRLALLLAETELLSFSTRVAQPSAPPPAAPATTPAPPPAPATTPAPPPAPPAAVPATPAVAKPPAAPPPGAPAAKPATTPAPSKAPPAPAPKPAPSPAPAAKPAAAPPKPPAPAAKPAAPAPAAAKPASTPVPTAGLDPAALKQLAEKLAKADHFEVLGVKRDAAGAQIKIAYFQLAKVYHPDAIPADTAPETRKLAADVFAKVSEAWGVIGDDAKRAKYLDDLKTGAGTEVDVMHIFKAEEAFNAGTLLVKARRYQEALAKFEEAVKLNAEEAEFHMWKAWCGFLLSGEKKKAQPGAASAIEAALKQNPRCVSGYLFLGQMAKIVGELPLAEKHLKRGLKEAPNNPDLERELKYLRK